ncbi:hypothetical protein MIMGU_mgv1a017374mg [Erythranthe guttata]|uniref:Uncharacterized protein n=1 Tax=Erythranthe guttata TaxID=4155 RepID=A0A022QK18_ERYGU|nr:hypothetical protein MIMGU_mgv1a017374mg [Erythranthe guttata]
MYYYLMKDPSREGNKILNFEQSSFIANNFSRYADSKNQTNSKQTYYQRSFQCYSISYIYHKLSKNKSAKRNRNTKPGSF